MRIVLLSTIVTGMDVASRYIHFHDYDHFTVKQRPEPRMSDEVRVFVFWTVVSPAQAYPDRLRLSLL